MSTTSARNASLIMLAVSLFVTGCSEVTSNQLPGNEIYVTDTQGRKYDVTYAIAHLGFELSKFSSSSGPEARPAIMEPEFALPGDRDYPGQFATSRIIGVALGGDARAYPLDGIFRFEVVDDAFGDTPIAVAY